MTILPTEDNLPQKKKPHENSDWIAPYCISPQAGRKTSSDTTVISRIRDDRKIYEITNINQFYIDLYFHQ